MRHNVRQPVSMVLIALLLILAFFEFTAVEPAQALIEPTCEPSTEVALLSVRIDDTFSDAEAGIKIGETIEVTVFGFQTGSTPLSLIAAPHDIRFSTTYFELVGEPSYGSHYQIADHVAPNAGLLKIYVGDATGQPGDTDDDFVIQRFQLKAKASTPLESTTQIELRKSTLEFAEINIDEDDADKTNDTKYCSVSVMIENSPVTPEPTTPTPTDTSVTSTETDTPTPTDTSVTPTETDTPTPTDTSVTPTETDTPDPTTPVTPTETDTPDPTEVSPVSPDAGYIAYFDQEVEFRWLKVGTYDTYNLQLTNGEVKIIPMICVPAGDECTYSVNLKQIGIKPGTWTWQIAVVNQELSSKERSLHVVKIKLKNPPQNHTKFDTDYTWKPINVDVGSVWKYRWFIRNNTKVWKQDGWSTCSSNLCVYHPTSETINELFSSSDREFHWYVKAKVKVEGKTWTFTSSERYLNGKGPDRGIEIPLPGSAPQ